MHEWFACRGQKCCLISTLERKTGWTCYFKNHSYVRLSRPLQQPTRFICCMHSLFCVVETRFRFKMEDVQILLLIASQLNTWLVISKSSNSVRSCMEDQTLDDVCSLSSSRDQLVVWLQYSRQNTLPTKSTTGSSKETVRQLSDNSLIRQKFAISSVNFYSTRMFDTIGVVQTSSSRKPFERKCCTKVRTYIKVKCHTVNRTQIVSIRRIQYTMDDFYA